MKVGISDAGNGLQRIGLRILQQNRVPADMFGPQFSDDQSIAQSEMVSKKDLNRPQVRSVDGIYLVSSPLINGSLYFWRVTREGNLRPEDIKQLMQDSLNLAKIAHDPLAKNNIDNKDQDKLLLSIFSDLGKKNLPKSAKKRALHCLETISQSTGWAQIMAFEMTSGKASKPTFVNQFDAAKLVLIKIFLSKLSASSLTIFSTLEKSDFFLKYRTEIELYRKEYNVDHFAIAIPESNGAALYIEGEAKPADLESARIAYAVVSGTNPEPNTIKHKKAIVGAGGLALALFLLWPIALEISAPGEVEPANGEVVVVPYDARLVSISARVGQLMEAGDVIAELVSKELEEDEKRATMDGMLEKLAAQEALAGQDYAKFKLADQRSTIAAFRAEQSKRRLNDLTVRAPKNGRVAFVLPETNMGSFLQAGTPVAEIQYNDNYHVRLSILASDGVYIHKGMTGSVIIRGRAEEAFPITILENPVINLEENGKQVLTVLAAIDAENIGNRVFKGLSGFARLSSDKAPRIWIWLRPINEYLRFSLWKYLGLQL